MNYPYGYPYLPNGYPPGAPGYADGLAGGDGGFGRMAPARLTMKKVGSLDERINIMQGLVAQGRRDPNLRQLAAQLEQRCQAAHPSQRDGCVLATVFWFSKANARYTHDITGVDTYQTAVRTLQFRGGDCDDAAILLCSILAILLFSVGFRVISTTGQSWEHVYALAGVPRGGPVQGVVPLDTTVPSSFPGWEPGKGSDSSLMSVSPGSIVRAKKDFFPLRGL